MKNVSLFSDNKKSFFLSLLFLKNEAKALKMPEIEKYVDSALQAILKFYDTDKTIAKDLNPTEVFIEKLWDMPCYEVNNLIRILENEEEMQRDSKVIKLF